MIQNAGQHGSPGSRLRGSRALGDRMDAEQRYWSVEECRWVKLPAREALYGEIYAEVPAQRADEPVQEPVEA